MVRVVQDLDAQAAWAVLVQWQRRAEDRAGRETMKASFKHNARCTQRMSRDRTARWTARVYCVL